MRRILRIIGVIIIVVILLLIISPFLFKGKLEDIVKKSINDNINAQVAWASLDVSLLSSFPNASVTIKDFTIVNNTPFEGDTLAEGRSMKLDMGIRQLFKKTDDDPIKVDALQLNEVVATIKIDKEGNANYDIGKRNTDKPTTDGQDQNAKPFTFDLDHYEINNSTVSYLDESSNTYLILSHLNHEGNGDFSSQSSTLSTETEAVVSLEIEDINYLNAHNIALTAAIDLDLKNQKYTFRENKGYINALPLTFDGFVQVIETGSLVDLQFKTPDSDFKNFLAIIPKTYAKNLDGVTTGGDFRVSGIIKGEATENTIPTMDIAVVSNNASFKYPDLPKRMDNINIDARVQNKTGNVDDTFISIHKLNFEIDDDVFSANGTIRNLTANMLVNLALQGTLDLSNLEKVYPLELQDPLSGIINADFSTVFDLHSMEKQQYENIKSTGTASLRDFAYTSSKLPKPIAIADASVNFTPNNIKLTNFEGQTGDTDIKATGTIQNLIPFVMSKEDLKGRFDVQSQVFNLNDFATQESADVTKSERTSQTGTVIENGIQIPDFLNASMDFTAQKVIYDDIELTEVSGTVAIQDEQAQLGELNSKLLGGEAGLTGRVSTKNNIAVFDVDLDLSKIDIDQSFKSLDLLKGLAPIAQALQGGLNTTVKLEGRLDENLTPVLSTIEGNAFAQLLTAQVHPEQAPLLNLLDNKLDFIDLSKIDLNKLKTNLEFKEGQVIVQPFEIALQDITIQVSGGHSFENVMDYKLSLDVPARYFGNDVSGLLSKLTNEEKENLSVDLPVSVSGNFGTPKVNLNTKAAISHLTNQIVEIQKKRLQDQATDAIDDVLGGILVGNKPKDSTSTNTSSSGQTPQVEDAIKDIAGGLLGGLLGGKKKKEQEAAATKKDSTNND